MATGHRLLTESAAAVDDAIVVVEHSDEAAAIDPQEAALVAAEQWAQQVEWLTTSRGPWGHHRLEDTPKKADGRWDTEPHPTCFAKTSCFA